MKGAPEVVISMCDRQLANDGQADLGEDEKNQILDKVTSMAAQPLRVMTLAYVEMDEGTWASNYGNTGATPEQAIEEAFQNGALPLVYIGSFGLKDSLRPKVQSCIAYARDSAQLNVRLVSGDHIETAKAIAYKAGILRNSEAGRQYSVMSAVDFREAVGGLVHRTDEETGERRLQVENPHVFHEIALNLKVLARATAADKHLLVVGLRNLGKKVAVTGDGINDVEALAFADVGISMGSGVSAAKESSSIVLTEDDFEASLRAVMWGRNIYHNITRFIQFQVTVNISCLLTVIVGIILFGQTPMNSVQLLWINLVMDTFAALALASEPPMPSVIQGPPFTDKVSILSPTVWRQIIGISLWNTVIMTILMMFGRLIAGLDDYSRDTPTIYSKPEGFDGRTTTPSAQDLIYIASQSKVRHLTYIFNVFICLQMLNMINCRKIGKRDFNVFENFFHNSYFLIIFVGIFGIQYALVNVFPSITGCVPLSKSEWGTQIAVGSSVLLASLLLKLTPEKWVNKIPTGMINEDAECDNKMLGKIKAVSAAAEGGNIPQEMKEEKAGDDFAHAP